MLTYIGKETQEGDLDPGHRDAHAHTHTSKQIDTCTVSSTYTMGASSIDTSGKYRLPPHMSYSSGATGDDG